MRTFKICSISNFQIQSPVFLAAVSTPYVRDVPRTYFTTGGLTDTGGNSESVSGTQWTVAQQQKGKLRTVRRVFQHYAEWKLQETHVLCDSIRTSFQSRQNQRAVTELRTATLSGEDSRNEEAAVGGDVLHHPGKKRSKWARCGPRGSTPIQLCTSDWHISLCVNYILIRKGECSPSSLTAHYLKCELILGLYKALSIS